MDISNSRLSRFRMLAALAILTLGFAGNALACSCVNGAIPERFAHASFVFVAQVIATDATTDIKEPMGWPGFVARYRLWEVIKASTPPPAQVYSGMGAGDCGIPLLPAISYVFFAGPEGNVTICSSTLLMGGREFSETKLSYIRSLADQTVPSLPAPLEEVDSWVHENLARAGKLRPSMPVGPEQMTNTNGRSGAPAISDVKSVAVGRNTARI